MQMLLPYSLHKTTDIYWVKSYSGLCSLLLHEAACSIYYISSTYSESQIICFIIDFLLLHKH